MAIKNGPMAEWPKVIERFEDAEGPAKRYEVIPADLGRELYRELKELLQAVHDEKHLGPVQESAAVARYEREVGT